MLGTTIAKDADACVAPQIFIELGRKYLVVAVKDPEKILSKPGGWSPQGITPVINIERGTDHFGSGYR
jgi:hypothetical protein